MPTPSLNALSEAAQTPISKPFYDRLRAYCALLQKWQKTHNLIAPSTLGQIWERHIVDSLQILPHIPKNTHSHLDFGSGGGLPGIVIAAAFADKIYENDKDGPGWQTDLVESISKKATFLSTVRRELKLPADIYAERIEDFQSRKVDSSYNLITARALADLNQLLSYAEPFISEETLLIFPKGIQWQAEIDAAMLHWQFEFEAIPSLTQSNASLLLIKNLYKRG